MARKKTQNTGQGRVPIDRPTDRPIVSLRGWLIAVRRNNTPVPLEASGWTREEAPPGPADCLLVAIVCRWWPRTARVLALSAPAPCGPPSRDTPHTAAGGDETAGNNKKKCSFLFLREEKLVPARKK